MYVVHPADRTGALGAASFSSRTTKEGCDYARGRRRSHFLENAQLRGGLCPQIARFFEPKAAGVGSFISGAGPAHAVAIPDSRRETVVFQRKDSLLVRTGSPAGAQRRY